MPNRRCKPSLDLLLSLQSHASTIFINSRQTSSAYQWRDCAVILSSQHVIRIPISLFCTRYPDSIASHTRVEKKCFIYTHGAETNHHAIHRMCFGTFGKRRRKSFRQMNKKEQNRKKSGNKNTEQKTFTNLFFLQFVILGFFFVLPSVHTPIGKGNNKKRRILSGKLMLGYCFRIFLRFSF